MTLVERAAAELSPADHGSPETDLSDAEPAALSHSRPAVSGLRLGLLRWTLKKRRHRLARHWNDTTRHPRTPRLPGDPLSVGQCGVSSAWLMPRLRRSWRSQARYCFGDVRFGADKEIAAFHCWVEIGDEASPRRLVIDLTFDQFDQFSRFEKLSNRPVLCEYYGDLTNWSIEYKANSRRSLEELRGDSVWDRYTALDQATSPVWRKAFRSLHQAMAVRSRSVTTQQQTSSGAAGSESVGSTAA
ncbi:hypothetical protein [Kribbella pratensis]|uniref:Uncharacterized protein n=1 Tax=Kribbella pratensis TaxID=2512112 RepID=A0A4R8CIT7_9ACTN|nr:hypothetical protein [Kribbella pratensis]TDW76136.1 hypothetical protein EV653_1281 [Kribbella pratensis]